MSGSVCDYCEGVIGDDNTGCLCEVCTGCGESLMPDGLCEFCYEYDEPEPPSRRITDVEDPEGRL